MRISTQSFYEHSQAAMSAQQVNMLRVQQQIGAGTRIVAPSDDPTGATRALGLSQAIAINGQYSASRAFAANRLSREETALQSVTTVLQNVKEAIVAAGNGTMSDADRATIATTLESSRDELLGLANTDDGNGQFLFAGFKSGSQPFVAQPGGVRYVGDQGQHLVQVDVSRQMASGDDGRSIFQTVQGGSGYVAASGAANAGTGVLGSPATVDSSDPNYGKDFVIRFSGTTPPSYQVDSADTPPVSIVPPTPFTPGSPLQFGGVQINISGTPAAGDTFSVSTAKNAGTDLFATLDDVIAALKTPIDTGTPAARAQLQNALSTANRKIANNYDNVLTVRSSVGSRLQELDTLQSVGDAVTLSQKSYLSDVQDLDYASAISDLYQRQAALQATQQTFLKIQDLALFRLL